MKYLNNEKLNQIKLDKDNMCVVIDFDRTITDITSDDSWTVAGSMLGEEFYDKMMDLYHKYRPIELDYQILFDEKSKLMEEWYILVMELYFEYGLTEKNIIESISNSNLHFRDGAKAFLKQMSESNIPVIIVSAGIGNVIKAFLKLNNCYFQNMHIISNFIEFNKSGKMKEIPTNIIHSLNKSMENHISSNLEDELQKREYHLLMGDLVEDKKMVDIEKWDKTISVGFLDIKLEKNLEVYKRNFDIVLTPDDANFKAVKDIVL